MLWSLAFVPDLTSPACQRPQPEGTGWQRWAEGEVGWALVNPNPSPVGMLAGSGRACGRACWPGVSLRYVPWGPVGELKGRKFLIRKPVGLPTWLSLSLVNCRLNSRPRVTVSKEHLSLCPLLPVYHLSPITLHLSFVSWGFLCFFLILKIRHLANWPEYKRKKLTTRSPSCVDKSHQSLSANSAGNHTSRTPPTPPLSTPAPAPWPFTVIWAPFYGHRNWALIESWCE